MALSAVAQRKPRKFYYQTETKNTSFIKIWALLDAKGIRNCAFFLRVYNKDLLDIDPYDPDITEEEAIAVTEECRINKFYFAREVFRLPVNGARITVGGGEPFQLHRSNLAQLWAADLNLNVMVLAPRQTGKTWGTICDLVHVYQFTRGCNILHFNKSQKDTSENVSRMKLAISMLPMYLQHSNPENMTPADKRNVKNNDKFMSNVVGSSVEAMASASSESKADAQARGRTAQKLWFDEIAYIMYNDTIMDAAYPTFVTASANAKKYGMPYGVSITTTPGNLNNPAGVYAYKFMNNCIKFTENMYDMDKDDYKDLYKMIEKSTDKNGFIFIQFQYYELGYSDEWYINATKSLDPIKARREYLLEWINSSSQSPFDIDDIDLLIDIAKRREKNVKQIRITKQFYMSRYSKYDGKLPVLISCDVSTGIGRDYNSIVVVNPETLEPMAIFKSNNISPPQFKKIIIKVVSEHYPHSILTIENNSIGHVIIQDLLETPIGRLIYREKKTRTVEMGVGYFNKKRKQEGYSYGHNVNAESRTQMTNILETLVRYNKDKLGYPELVDEVKFMEFRQGRIQHSTATHDDVTFGYLGALYIVRHGTGLRGRGIVYSIAEDYDESIEFDDVEDIRLNVAATLRKHDIKNFDVDEDDMDMMEFFSMKSYSMSDILKEQSREYLRNKDKIDGIEDESFFMAGSVGAIPRDIKNRILGGANNYEFADDVVRSILANNREDMDVEYHIEKL